MQYFSSLTSIDLLQSVTQNVSTATMRDPFQGNGCIKREQKNVLNGKTVQKMTTVLPSGAESYVMP